MLNYVQFSGIIHACTLECRAHLCRFRWSQLQNRESLNPDFDDSSWLERPLPSPTILFAYYNSMVEGFLVTYITCPFEMGQWWGLMAARAKKNIHYMKHTAPDTVDGITTTRLRTSCLRHFVYRHFVYRHFVYWHLVYYGFPCWNRSWSDETNTIGYQ